MKNKKIIITALILIIVIITIRTSIVNTLAKQVNEDPQAILYQDVTITALTPTIIEAISDYYKNLYTATPFFDSSTIKILNIERPNGNRTSYFIIKIEVRPFFGPHIPVGIDIITIELSYPGLQVLKKYEHVKSYPLPERYNNLYLN